MRRAGLLLVALAASGASAQTAGQAAASSCAGLSVTHAMGTACVPRAARRVVALEWTYAEDLLALGVQPLGMADIRGYGEWVRIATPLAASVQDVGTRQQPSLEQIRALKPDLILTTKLRSAQNYAQLAAIAPTVVFDPYAGGSQYGEMRQTFATIGRLTGRQNTARQVLSNVDARLARLGQDLKAARRSGESFVFAQAYAARGGAPTLRLFTKNSMVSEVLEKIGLRNAWTAGRQPYGFSEVSIEPLATLDTQNFLYVGQSGGDVFADPTVRPLWQRLPFVKSGRAYALNDKTWTFGGPLSTLTLADEISRKMVGR